MNVTKKWKYTKICHKKDRTWKTVSGYVATHDNVPGLEFIVHQSYGHDGWTVTETLTGAKVADSNFRETMESALELADYRLKTVNLNQMLDKMWNAYKEMPEIIDQITPEFEKKMTYLSVYADEQLQQRA